ncbi:MAG: hypothetical protein RM021_034465, partial [Nostoc sp. EkiNYC01]|nr:hypothetical protein [Nostoc sp. EkiNYC01]
REFDKPHPPNLPLLKGEGGARKIKVLLPSPRRRGVGGEVKTVLIELTLKYCNPIDLMYLILVSKLS